MRTYEQDAVLNCTVDLEFENVHVALLSEAMSTIESLVLSITVSFNVAATRRVRKEAHLESRIPPEVNEDDVIACSQIQP